MANIPGEKEFLNTEYETYFYGKVDQLLSQWLQGETTTSEELELDMREQTGGVANRILGVEEFNEGQITLFFEYRPALPYHPVQVLGKQILGIPDVKKLKNYYNKSESMEATSRPLVLLQENGVYINRITVQSSKISADKLEINTGLLREKSIENWDRIINPRKYIDKKEND